ncbi:MAG: methyltransferase [Hyphomicrobiaceae bacterium]|nr:methyltransferase [Hyphomicrobiaceae bacterium]
MSDQERDLHDLDLLLRGFQISRLLRLAADLGMADRIAATGSRSMAELAAECGVLPVQLTRVVRALAAFGIFQLSPDATVSHSPRSLLLRSDHPRTMHYAARFWTGPGSWKAWAQIDAAMTGGSPHEAAWGMGRFDYLRHHPEEARVFDDMMAHFPGNRHAAVADAYDFSHARLIADVGGGNGAALRHILARFPDVRGVVFDREDVVAALTSEDLMQGRISAAGGDFFERAPTGADMYLLNRVLHDWNDEACIRILETCRRSMESAGTLLIIDEILEPDPSRGKPASYLIDAHMMAMFGEARERTQSEFQDLLSRADFAISNVIATRSPVSIVEAKPVARAG